MKHGDHQRPVEDQCAQEYCYATPGRSEASSTTTASAAKKGAATSSSSSEGTKPKRTIEKSRKLHRRHSDGEVRDRATKALGEEFDKVMNVDGGENEDEHDPELIPEARPQEGATAAAAPPQWWSAAWHTIEHKMDSQARQLAERMSRMFEVSNERFGHLELALTKQPEKTQRAMAELDEKINMEARTRENENAENMKRIEERLQNLELNRRDMVKVEPKEKAETSEIDSNQWRHKHAILGGCPPTTTKAKVDKEARDWLQRQSEEITSRCLQP